MMMEHLIQIGNEFGLEGKELLDRDEKVRIEGERTTATARDQRKGTQERGPSEEKGSDAKART